MGQSMKSTEQYSLKHTLQTDLVLFVVWYLSKTRNIIVGRWVFVFPLILQIPLIMITERLSSQSFSWRKDQTIDHYSNPCLIY